MAEMKIGTEVFNVVIDGPDDAPALLMSNSLATNLHMWDGQIPALTKAFRVIRYDSRGHGGSVADDGPYSIQQLGQDALNILDALGVDKASFVGLSLGGMVGQWLLTHHGERIEKAVLANTGAHMGNSDFWNMRIRAARNDGMAELVAGTIERWFSSEFQEKSADAAAKVGNMVRTTPPLGYASCCAAIRDMDQREAIRSITRPVLVIVGTKDHATPPAMGGLIAGTIPGARLIDLDAAHLSNIEAELAFNRAVVSFLSASARTAKPAKKAARKAVRAIADAAGAAGAAIEAVISFAGASKKKPATKTAAKKRPAKKAAAKKAAGKKTAAKKPVAGKAAKKASKKPAKKSAVTKKSSAKKITRKAATRKAVKQASKKPARKGAAKKSPQKVVKKVVKKKAVKKAAKKSRR